MDIKKEILAIKKRLTHLESHSNKPKSGKTLVEDAVIRREREEDNPRFTDKELQIHTELHKKGMLVPHKHKESTSKQFHWWTFGTPEEQAAQKKKEDARIAADRANLAVEKEKEAEWRRLIKRPPQSIKVDLHKRTLRKRSLPYAWVTWKDPKPPTNCKHLISKGRMNYKILGYTVEVNGSAWPMITNNRVKRRLLRSYSVGSKVRIGVNYQYGNRNGLSWSCFKWRRS